MTLLGLSGSLIIGFAALKESPFYCEELWQLSRGSMRFGKLSNGVLDEEAQEQVASMKEIAFL